MNRQEIIQYITEKLSPNPSLIAAWIAGSAAFGRVDEWSDIDLSLLCAEGEVDAVFANVEEIISAISPIELTHPILQSWPGIKQKFYRLKDLGEFLVFDVCVFQPSSPDLFLDSARHGKAIVLFDKTNAVQEPPFDQEALDKKLTDRLSTLRTQFSMFQMLIKKELLRGNLVEALEFYRNYTLRPLVELLRIKHDPRRHDFHVRYLRYDLPEEEQRLLQELYFVATPNDLKAKQEQAEKIFARALTIKK